MSPRPRPTSAAIAHVGSDAAPEPGLALRISPSGHLTVAPATPDDGDAVLVATDAAAARITAAFARGTGHGLLHLGAAESATALPASFGFVRDLGRRFVAALCGVADLESQRGAAVVPCPPRDELEALAAAVPAFVGAEYVDAERLAALWTELAHAFRAEIEAWPESVQAYLQAKSPLWALVGRVYFHLAENREDDERPFAFLATYTTRLSERAKVQHRPLGDAVRASATAGDRAALLSLLLPVQRAAEHSPWLAALVDSGELFQPLPWTAREAHRFLQEVPTLEAAGVLVRVPDWWRAKRGPRVEVTATVGGAAPATIGLDAILDFQVGMAIDGEPLADAEWRALLAGTESLALVRGRWVEVDRERLAAVLAHWTKVERQVARDGLSFAEGMRLLAGATAGATAGRGADAAAPEAADWSRVVAGDWLATALRTLRSPEAVAAADPGDDIHATLRPYQRAGVSWLWALDRLGLGACLADDMGLGKTIQVLGLLALRKRHGEARASLLVVPASLIANWEAEVARFAPGLTTAIASRAAPETPADLVITTYGSVHRHGWLRDTDWGVVILDEAQAIKNPGAQQSRAVKALRSQRRVALTGTPVENRLGDLWSLFDFLNPGLLGTAADFRRFAKRLGADYAPLRTLVRPYILRRMKSDRSVIADLPDKTEVTAFCGLTQIQAALYQQAVEDLRAQLAAGKRSGIQRRGAVLASLLRMKQICNHPSQWLGDGAYAADASAKYARLRELCEAIASRQEKVLVFTQFREMTAPLATHLESIFGRPGLVLHGQTAVTSRQALVDRFQTDDAIPFFVLSVKAGGTGLNLTAASHVIHFDRWWNPAVENQATDRAYRIGQRKNVLVHKLVCRGTVEERIDALIEAKRGLAHDLVEGGGEAALTELGDDQLLDMIALDIHRALETT